MIRRRERVLQTQCRSGQFGPVKKKSPSCLIVVTWTENVAFLMNSPLIEEALVDAASDAVHYWVLSMMCAPSYNVLERRTCMFP
jgi:hypothetical protein